jgi:ribosomal protein S5
MTLRDSCKSILILLPHCRIGLKPLPYKGRTIRYDVSARVGTEHVFLRTAPAGTGVIAGGPMRSVN